MLVNYLKTPLYTIGGIHSIEVVVLLVMLRILGFLLKDSFLHLACVYWAPVTCQELFSDGDRSFYDQWQKTHVQNGNQGNERICLWITTPGSLFSGIEKAHSCWAWLYLQPNRNLTNTKCVPENWGAEQTKMKILTLLSVKVVGPWEVKS